MSRRVTIREPKPENMPIGEALYQARHRANLTQAELSAMIGVAQKNYSNVERNRAKGINSINAEALANAVEILGYDRDLAYYKRGELPPDVLDTLTQNWTLYKALVDEIRKAKG